MRSDSISVGNAYHKAGRPKIVWMVDRFKPGDGIAHVVLRRADDPTTQIMISAMALSDRLLFRQASVTDELAN